MINYIDKYTTQIFVLQMGMLVILSAIILWVYYYNRKKYHNLKHQIPASVVKNYLDSIIQNSTALKSSLFRGGGLDVDPSSIPSVMPLDQLQTSTPIGVSTSGGDEALRAEVARLQSQLTEKQNIITDLENKSTDLEGTVKAKQERIEELEKLLAEAQANEGTAGGGDDEALKAQLAEVTTERDSLKEDLAQYDIIEDDLADLKRLKQENEQLRAALEGSGGSVPEAAPVAEAAPVPAAEPVVAEPEPVAVAEAAPEAVAEPAAAAPVEEVAVAPAAEDDKSPEDLLSEFEKMLG
ncbi:MAG: hypothetical protein ACJAS4_000836 [Bacteriovoracaceae bacterium]|jgi:hypothetical protein